MAKDTWKNKRLHHFLSFQRTGACYHRAVNLRSAVSHVNHHGMLLVFPLKNRKEPRSLWSEFFPRTRLRWEWDDSGQSEVFELWHLRERLSRSGRVIYTKWWQGRATLISREMFPALLRALNPELPRVHGLSFVAREVLDLLLEDSPISTKHLKKLADLQGRENEARYNRALKELWSRLLIVGYGEVDEGAFPSLAIGATQLMFEDLWQQALELRPASALAQIQMKWSGPEEKSTTRKRALVETSSFAKYFARLSRSRSLALEASHRLS